MPKKRKPAKVRGNFRAQALADVEKVQKACEKLELDLKRVKDDIRQMPHCPTYGTKCSVYKAD